MGKHFPFVFQNFKISYIGIFAPHVWIYCVMHRVDIDYDGVILGIPLYTALSLGMLVVMMITWRKPGMKMCRPIVWVLVAAMIGATVFLMYPFSFTNWIVVSVAAFISGLGVACLYLGWVPFYAALDIKNAIASIFAAMAVGSGIKILIDLMPALPAVICMSFLPVVSIAMSYQAQKHQPPLEVEPQIYHQESRSSVPWRILLGVVVYSIIIGMMQTISIEVAYTPYELLIIVHHGAEIIVASVVLWWVFVRKGLLRFSSLWKAILLFTATGLFFLPIIGVEWTGWALVLVAIAQTLIVMLFWIMLADVAHHSALPPFVIFGSGWLAYSFSFAVGEIFGNVVASFGVSMYVITLMTYFLTLAAVFALNENNLSQRRIFSDLEMVAPEESLYANIDAGCVAIGKAHKLTKREIEVLQLLCKGRSKAYIGEDLFISENTVRSHTKHIYEKLNVHSKQEILNMMTDSLQK